MDTKRRVRELPLSLAVSAALFLAAFLLIRFSYEANDDLAMASILNGSYTGTPDAHAVFLLYPLSCLISLLYATGIQISWYQVVLTGACLIAVAALVLRLLRRFPAHPVLACLLPAAGVSVLWLTQLMRFTFTTCGAFVAAVLILCYALQPPEEDLRPGNLAGILLLLFLAFCIRNYFGYLALAFLAVVWLVKYARVLTRQRSCWLIPLAGLLVVGGIYGIHRLAYRDWTDFLQYNEERVYLQDYGNFPDYEDAQALLQSLGYDKAAYTAVTQYDYDLLESYSPETIHAIYQYVKEEETPKSARSVAKKTLKRAIKYYFTDDLSELTPLQAASYLLPAALLLLSAFWSVRDRKWHILPAGLLLFGMGCCYLVIGYQGRYPSRVASSLRILVVGASLAGLALLLSAHPIRLRRPLTIGAAVLLSAAVLWGFASARTQLGAPQRQTGMEYLSYIAQTPDNIYIRETRSTQYNKSLLSEYPKVSSNVIGSGGWISYSPLYEQKLARMGLDELNRSTLFQDNVYLIVHEKYDLHDVLGVSSDTEILYEVVQDFDDGIRILDIQSIGA